MLKSLDVTRPCGRLIPPRSTVIVRWVLTMMTQYEKLGSSGLLVEEDIIKVMG